MFTKKKDKFMVQLEEMVFNLDRAAVEFGKMDFNTHLDLKAYSDNIKTYESHGDELMHKVISDLNQTFITPIEREDILSLCNAYTDEYMAEFVDNIQKAVAEMKLAVGLLVDKKLSHMRIHSINIKEFETNCDGILRQSIKHIFNSETDPITLIKIKDIYESLENIADKCQAVANNFETIIMKNS